MQQRVRKTDIPNDIAAIPDICPFWYTTILFRSVKSTPTKCVNLEQNFFSRQNSVNEKFWSIWCFFACLVFFAYLVFFWHSWCFFWHSWCFLAYFLVYLVFFGVFGVFWRIWCFALRTCFLFGVLGVWFGVFGILSSLKMCRFLLINFAESSLYRVLCGKKYTGWKKVHHRRLCGCGLI